ncbi:MAG TPA: aminoglycoside phosphotransferase family protein [Rubrobacter sp.]
MSGGALEVPEAVRRKAIARGPEGRRWLDRLGRLIGELEQDWGVAVGPALPGGSESYVAAARTDSGVDAAIKLEMPPYASFASEVRTLVAADGRGYVRLLDHDEERKAMLQERLGPSLRGFGLPIPVQIEILCATLKRAWDVPVPAGLPSGAEKARWLSEFIAGMWEEVNRPCSRRVVEQALAFAKIREAAFDPETAVLVHGDAHSANALQDPGQAPTRFKFVDPDGLVAEPAYDLAIPMREWSRELLDGDAARLGRERCAYLSRLTGVDHRGIWEWGFVERVSTGLLAIQVGADEMGKGMLEVAEAFATA